MEETETKKKVLIVEDDQFTQAITRRWLLDSGYEVVTASNGGDVVYLVQREAPDLILLDLGLDEGDPFAAGIHDGFEVLEWIRLRITDQKPPLVIVITGRKEAGLKERALKAGALALFQKPVHKERMLRAVQVALA